MIGHTCTPALGTADVLVRPGPAGEAASGTRKHRRFLRAGHV